VVAPSAERLRGKVLPVNVKRQVRNEVCVPLTEFQMKRRRLIHSISNEYSFSFRLSIH